MLFIGFEQALWKLLIALAVLTTIAVFAALARTCYIAQRQARRPTLTRLASSSHVFGTQALSTAPISPVVRAESIPRQSSAMRFQRLSSSIRSSSRDRDRALGSPERGMNAILWRLDDREERREQATPAERDHDLDGASITPPDPRRLSYHVSGWGYSSARHRQTQSSPIYPRPISAVDPRIGPSPAPTPQSFLRPPSSINTTLPSRPPSMQPLLPNRTPSAAQRSAIPAPQSHTHGVQQHGKTQSSPASLFCFRRRLSLPRPRLPARGFSISGRKAKRHSIAAANASYQLSPLHIKTPKAPNSVDVINRSNMAEPPLGNITNTGLRRISSIDIDRKTAPRLAVVPATEADTAQEAYERFSYHTGPGPVMVDATVLPVCDTPTFRQENMAKPVKGKGRMVDVKRKSKSVAIRPQTYPPQGAGLDGKSRSVDLGTRGARIVQGWKDKPLPRLPRTDTTPWIEDLERGVGFEPFEVVFD